MLSGEALSKPSTTHSNQSLTALPYPISQVRLIPRGRQLFPGRDLPETLSRGQHRYRPMNLIVEIHLVRGSLLTYPSLNRVNRGQRRNWFLPGQPEVFNQFVPGSIRYTRLYSIVATLYPVTEPVGVVIG
jgi:hypothetical protein